MLRDGSVYQHFDSWGDEPESGRVAYHFDATNGAYATWRKRYHFEATVFAKTKEQAVKAVNERRVRDIAQGGEWAPDDQ
jgi:hypothetical protein